MKGKKITYLLIVGVAAVWGIIFYRIYSSMTEEAVVPVFSGTAKKVYFKEANHQADKVSVNMDYRDPFSADHGFVDVEVGKVNLPLAMNAGKAAVQQQPVNWPTILYKGYISNPSTKQRIAIIQVNGTQEMLAEGQSSNGLKLIKNLRDSVQVSYRNSTKYIRLN